jgi:hypothetical protein
LVDTLEFNFKPAVGGGRNRIALLLGYGERQRGIFEAALIERGAD